MTNRNLDIDVAWLLDLDVPGEVPFYHEHDALARQALERICDKLQLNAKLRRDSKWSVSLYSKRNGRRVVFELDKSFSLAICKALAKLRSKE